MSSSAPQVDFAGRKVGQIGFGLMQLTWNPQPPSQETSFAAMKAAVDNGCTAWSTALFYGNFHESADKLFDNIRLIAAFFEKYPEYSDKVILVVKGGITASFQPTLDLDTWRDQLKKAQSILGDRKMDIVSAGRHPPGSTAEDVANTLKTLRDEGYFEHAGASEVSAETVEKMNKIIPIEVVEIEVSLWSWEKDIQETVAYCKSNSIPVFAYSPLGRGFISRTWKTPEDVPKGSFQSTLPRFQGEAFYDNLKLVDQLDELAAAKGLKTTQLALAWIAHLSPYNIPIPGSSNPGRIAENAQAASIKLTDEDLKGINDTLAKFELNGGRYDDHAKAVLMR